MDKSPRQVLSSWLRKEMVEADEIDMPALANRAVIHFRGDVAFLQAWAEDTLRPVAYTLGTQIAAQSRIPHVIHDEAAPDEPAEATKRTIWLDRLEHVGDRYVRLRSMGRADVLAWVEERRERGTTELHLAGLGEKLAAKMAEGQTVGEVFSDDEIDRWAKQLRVHVKVNIPVPAKFRRSEEAAD
jgi:hypothetical protein